MKAHYLVEITNPETHIVTVKLSIPKPDVEKISFFLPSWSPGSYLMREYSRHMQNIKVLSQNGEFIRFSNTAKGTWEINLKESELNSTCESLSIEYEVYCHELTVRTSHIDESHAFLHGPSYLIGLLDYEIEAEIEFRFPPLWSKIHIGLKDISTERSRFIYAAKNYDELVDAPAEIGCHESDGFSFDGKDHHLIWYGESFPHGQNLKEDIKTIVKTVASHFSDIPYESYLFMTHLKKNLYGGLEHLNSTALQFDGRKLANREDYINWLALVAHEYFHTWNVKRIRPIELGPFNYREENYTELHWLTEGLTSFMDEIFVLRAGLCSLEEYLNMQAKNLQRYFEIQGKKFYSLELASYNTWIKQYRPDENTNNSYISYYLKGGLVFSTLHFEFQKIGKSVNDLLDSLWARYKENPAVGVTKEEVLFMIEKIGNKEIRDQFELRISTTEDIDFESYYKHYGMSFDWEESAQPYMGVDLDFVGDRVIVSKVHLDGPAYTSGLNAGDEIISLAGIRMLKDDIELLSKHTKINTRYDVLVARLGSIIKLDILMGKTPRRLRKILVTDEARAKGVFL